MAKESEKPVTSSVETTLEQQKRGVSTLSGAVQIGIGVAAFAASLFTGLPLYLATPISGLVGVAASAGTNYLVSSSIGENKETGMLARAAGAAARQADRLIEHLPRTLFKKDKENKKTKEELSALQDKGGRGLYYVGAGLTLASVVVDIAKSFLPVPTPSVTALLLPTVMSGIWAFNSFTAGSKKALSDTTIGDAQEALGGMAEAIDDTSKKAIKNHVAASVTGMPIIGSIVQGISLFSALGSMVTQCATIWHLNRNGIRNAADGIKIAAKCSSYNQVDSALKIFTITAIIIAAVLLIASTAGAAAGVAGLAVITPAVVGGIACIFGAIAGACSYYYHGSKTFQQVMAQEEKQKALDMAKGKESPSVSQSQVRDVAAANPEATRTFASKVAPQSQPSPSTGDNASQTREAAQGLRAATHHPHEGAPRHPTATTDRPKPTSRSRDAD